MTIDAQDITMQVEGSSGVLQPLLTNYTLVAEPDSYTWAANTFTSTTVASGVSGFEPNVNFIYVDTTSIGSSYNPTLRDQSGSDTSYGTIQAAVDAVNVGETIRIRDGVYNNQGIKIPSVSKRGTAWTQGNWYGVESYPGEWAILGGNYQGGGGSATDGKIFYDDANGSPNINTNVNEVKYWKFERLEFKDGLAGVYFHGGPTWYRYCYFHDMLGGNGTPVGAIFIGMGQDCIIEYNWFFNNVQEGTNYQMAHVMFDCDYQDDNNPAGTWNTSKGPQRNIIRYNYMETSVFGIHYKNSQRFGNNVRDPNTVMSSYGEWGDDVHHNLILDNDQHAMYANQDCLQIHHNIMDKHIAGSWNSNTHQYAKCIYNNTMKAATTWQFGGIGYYPTGYRTDSGNVGNLSSFSFYDENPPQVLHPFDWCLNNIISDGGGGSSFDPPILMWSDMDENNPAVRLDMDDSIVDRNLVNNDGNSSSEAIDVGGNYYSISGFNTASDGWRSLAAGTVKNWDIDGTLYVNTTGSDQYRANGSFSLGGGLTVADGGYDAVHPFRSGVSFPDYIGANNPAGSLWIDGLIDDVTNTTWLRAQTGTPSWVE